MCSYSTTSAEIHNTIKVLSIAKLSQQKPANLSKFLLDIEKVKVAKHKEALGYRQRIE